MRLIRYRFIQILRDYTSMFWSFAWPFILGTLFYFSFGNAENSAVGEDNWRKIPIAYITQSDTPRTKAFETFLTSIDETMITKKNYTDETLALKDLGDEKILGIFYGDDKPTLSISKNGINESILSSILETYNQNSAIVTELARLHPERILSFMENIADYKDYTKNVSLGGTTLNPLMQYFFALLAYACLSGAFLGIRSSFDSQANLTPLGVRRSITPIGKLRLILTDFLVLFVIQFSGLVLLTLYLTQVLRVNLGNNLPSLMGVEFMGSIIGVTMGIAIGALTRTSIGVKEGIGVVATLVPSFLAGLMFGHMKNIIEDTIPIINRINPAAVLSDAFYCLGVYQNSVKYQRSLIILGMMSVFFLIIAFLGLRRQQYDSI